MKSQQPTDDEEVYPPMTKLRALDLRLLAGRPPRYDPDFVDAHAITFDAADGLPPSLRRLQPMHPLKEAAVVAMLLLIFTVPLLVGAVPLLALLGHPHAALGLAAPMALSVGWPSRYWPACQTAWLASWMIEYWSTVSRRRAEDRVGGSVRGTVTLACTPRAHLDARRRAHCRAPPLPHAGARVGRGFRPGAVF